jgi:hypothetical protein
MPPVVAAASEPVAVIVVTCLAGDARTREFVRDVAFPSDVTGESADMTAPHMTGDPADMTASDMTAESTDMTAAHMTAESADMTPAPKAASHMTAAPACHGGSESAAESRGDREQDDCFA